MEELFRWINFIILAVVLYVVLSKVLPRALQDHRQKIQQAIDEAKPAEPKRSDYCKRINARRPTFSRNSASCNSRPPRSVRKWPAVWRQRRSS